ncbi:995_t:CDS:2, partial [Ambispora leptoticha]
ELVLAVKFFLKLNGLNEPANGGMGSYTVFLLVISFLQHHRLLRTKQINACQNLGVLLIEFFDLYGNKFNYQDLAVCVKSNGNYLYKAETLISTKRPDTLVIIDPCNHTNNVASATFNWKIIRYEFAAAAKKLIKAVSQVHDKYFQSDRKSSNEPIKFSILGSIFNMSREWQRERNHIIKIYNDIKAGRTNSFSSLENDLDYVFSDEHLRIKLANIESVYEGYIQAAVAQKKGRKQYQNYRLPLCLVENVTYHNYEKKIEIANAGRFWEFDNGVVIIYELPNKDHEVVHSEFAFQFMSAFANLQYQDRVTNIGAGTCFGLGHRSARQSDVAFVPNRLPIFSPYLSTITSSDRFGANQNELTFLSICGRLWDRAISQTTVGQVQTLEFGTLDRYRMPYDGCLILECAYSGRNH